jgi:hypothetical protein
MFYYTVDIFSGEPGESAQLRSPSKISGEFLPIWANFVHCSAEEFADLGKFRPNPRNLPEIFEGDLNCADSPISGEKNNYCVHFVFEMIETVCRIR